MSRRRKILLAAGLVALLVMLTVSGAGAATLGGNSPTLAVWGEGVVTVAPDQAKLVLGVTSTGKTAQEAQAANTKACNQVLAGLEQAGIPREKIQTSGYTIYPQFDYSVERSGKPPVITGYQVNQTLTVTVDQLDLLGSLIDSAVSQGANRVEQVIFTKADNGQDLREALTLAVKDAKAKADAIAAAMGVTIVGVATVTEEGVSAPETYLAFDRLEGMGGGSTQIMPGQLELKAGVQIVYTIK